MSVQLVIVVIYLILLFGASAVAVNNQKKKQVSGDDFLTARKGFSTIMIAGMIAGCAIGGSATIGVAQHAMTGGGLSAGMYTFAWAVAAVILGYVGLGRMRRINMTTVPSLFQNVFGNTAKLMMTIGQLIIMVTIVSLQYVAGGSILSAMLPEYFSYTTGMVITAVCFIGITAIGGMQAAGFTNVINMIIIEISLLLATVLAVGDMGSMVQLAESLPEGPEWFSLTGGVGLAVVIGWVITMSTSVFSTQQNIQIGLAARTSGVARKGMLIGALIMIPVGILSAVLGMIAAIKYPDVNSASALPVVALSLHPAIGGLVLSGLWAADISTGVGLLLGASTIISCDIVNPILEKQGKEKTGIWANRIGILVVGIVTLFMAFSINSILGSLMTAQCITPSFCVLLLFMLYKPSMCRQSSAVVTMAVSYIVLLLWMFVPATHIVSQAIYLEWPVCFVAFILTAVFDKRPVTVPALSDEDK